MHSRNTDPDKDWVRVEDAMPKRASDVLIITKERSQYVAYAWGGAWRKDLHDVFRGLKLTVTHWRHLPAPPKEGE